MHRLFTFTFAALLAAAGVCDSANAQYAALARRVPTDANTIAFVNVEELMQTPLARKEGWAENAQKAFESGLLVIPPNVNRFVASARIDLHTMEVAKHTYIYETTIDPDMAQIATRYGGTVDSFGGYSAAVLPGDYFVVKFTPKYTVLGNPAVRQDVAYYVRRVDNDSMVLSEYLEEAKKFAENGAPIIMAVDLSDSIPASFIRTRLEQMASLKDKNLNLDALSTALASVRGVTLGITVNQDMVGSVKVDFAQDVSGLGDAVKPLFLEVLGHRGMMVDEMNDWEVKASGNTVQLIGKLEMSGLRRILSLLPVPPPLREAAEQTAELPQEDVAQKMAAAASQNYFKSVSSLVDDLQEDKKHRSTMGQTAVFYDKYADKIDRLPILNVDPYLLDYGNFVSGSLRNGSTSVRGALTQGTINQRNVPTQYDYQSWSTPIGVTQYGAYGWGGWSATEDVRATAALQSNERVKAQIAGGASANEIMQQVKQATAETRQKMTQKYQVNF